MSGTLQLTDGTITQGDALRVTGMTAVIVDPFPLWHRAVEGVLTSLGVETVGTASMPSDGITLIEHHRPDILVTDIDFGGGLVEGASFVRDAQRAQSGLRIVVLSTHHEMSLVSAAIQAGAAAYAVKTVRPEDLAAAIRQTFEHSIFLAPHGDRDAAAEPAAPDDERPARPAAADSAYPVDDLMQLTKREREILALVAQGHANAAIAQQLWVTEQTVKFHLSNIYRKLGVTNRTQASQWLHRRGAAGDHRAAVE